MSCLVLRVCVFQFPKIQFNLQFKKNLCIEQQKLNIYFILFGQNQKRNEIWMRSDPKRCVLKNDSYCFEKWVRSRNSEFYLRKNHTVSVVKSPSLVKATFRPKRGVSKLHMEKDNHTENWKQRKIEIFVYDKERKLKNIRKKETSFFLEKIF